MLLHFDKFEAIWQFLHCCVILCTHLSSPLHKQPDMHTVLFVALVLTLMVILERGIDTVS